MWHDVSKAVVSAVLVSALGLSGCQVAGSDVSERDGYFTWVDERGQVRYSRIPESDSAEPEPEPETVHDGQVLSNPKAAEPADEYTLENYPDGDELAARGNVRPGQRQPYFTWRDADGNVRVSYYTPDGRERPPWGSDKPPVTLTEATVYLPEAGEATTPPVEGYDPDAMAILGIEPAPGSPFLRFDRQCCEGLSGEDRIAWQEGREFAVRVDEESPSHAFSTGPSRFQLVALPAEERLSDFVMRLRSYARDGVLVPSMAFVDEDFRPLRVVTDLVMSFTPETWRKRGYLEAWVPVFPQQGERWLVLFTRPEDLGGQTLYEGDTGPVVVPHTDVGEFGIATFED
ncbi:MAG: MalM family protein [Pseudomonadota bacterium]|nr:MalM family protein [Pseudomonadota bacterium]